MRQDGTITTAVNLLSRAFGGAAALLLAAMALLTLVDVVSRYAFNQPVRGVLELLELAMALFVFLGLPDNSARGGDVCADFFADRWPWRLKDALDCAAAVLGVALCALIAWGTAGAARQAAAKGDLTPSLLLPLAPFQYVAACGAALLTLVFLARFVASARSFAGSPGR